MEEFISEVTKICVGELEKRKLGSWRKIRARRDNTSSDVPEKVYVLKSNLVVQVRF